MLIGGGDIVDGRTGEVVSGFGAEGEPATEGDVGSAAVGEGGGIGGARPRIGRTGGGEGAVLIDGEAGTGEGVGDAPATLQFGGEIEAGDIADEDRGGGCRAALRVGDQVDRGVEAGGEAVRIVGLEGDAAGELGCVIAAKDAER